MDENEDISLDGIFSSLSSLDVPGADEVEEEEEDFSPPVDVRGLVLKMKSKKRYMFKLSRETRQLDIVLKRPPEPDECYKMLSVGGGFSSLAIIKWISEAERIEELYVSTFRVGRNHFRELMKMYESGALGEAHFVTSTAQKKLDLEYDYYGYVQDECSRLGWEMVAYDNHSKLLLMRTANSFYVCETSSNLNENPKMEQFSLENDEALYGWYRELLVELIALGKDDS